MAGEETIRMEFNGREVTAPAGITVLRAAELNDVYIPTLCSHKDLSPFGGCRLCLVEIEGIRGYPLACNTAAADGMKVVTDTVAIHEIRRELLQLILSEHPSSCLICTEREECRKFMGTVRKSGVTTGCRYCPNDRQCELQDLVERFEITEINYPILYRHYETERMDPFFDRDYNICILCGRCVRMCQEMRGTAVLAFNYRGPRVLVGPAFGRNHIEAGCEFCGACVSVCPTGALAEKASKWDGKPDGFIVSTCPYCAIGCQLEFHHKNGRFSSALPALDPEVNDGQACVKGRFCIGEVSHHVQRARKPFAREGEAPAEPRWKEKTWLEALDIAASALKDVKPGEYAMLVSPDCTNESLYAAQKFARTVIGTNAIDSTARRTLGGGLATWTHLFSRPISIQGIKDASRILAVGLDTRFSFSIIGVEIRKAMQKGAGIVTIGPRESNLARYADIWLRPSPGFEGTLLKALAKGTKKAAKEAAGAADVDTKELDEAISLIKSGENLVVILGPSAFMYSALGDLLEAIEIFSKKRNRTIIPLYVGANTRGALEMGVFPELLPGPSPRTDSQAVDALEKAWGAKLPEDDGITVDQLVKGEKRPRVLHLVGTHPFVERPDCDFLIVQDIFEPDFDCDLYLPATSFLESGGTLTNVEGRVQSAPRLEELPDSVMYGRARPDWWIFAEIAKVLGADGLNYRSEDEILSEIASIVPGFPSPGKLNRRKRTLQATVDIPQQELATMASAPAKGNFLLAMRPMGYTHRGVSITSKVEGLAILNPETGFYLGQEDAEALGVCEGEMLVVSAGSAKGVAPARIERELPRGVIYLYVPDAFGGLEGSRDLEGLYRLDANPCPVEVTKDAI